MKKLLALITCACTISMHAMEVNEQSARAFVIYKGIKQLIMNPPVFAYPVVAKGYAGRGRARHVSAVAQRAKEEATSGYALFYNDFVCK